MNNPRDPLNNPLNSPLERYLNTASKGLVGAAKERVMRELRGNLELRARELHITGLSPTQAMHKALEEMGAPQTLSRAMTRIYTLPTLGKVLTLGLLGVGFTLSSLVAASRSVGYLVDPRIMPIDKTMGYLRPMWVDSDSFFESLKINMAENPLLSAEIKKRKSSAKECFTSSDHSLDFMGYCQKNNIFYMTDLLALEDLRLSGSKVKNSIFIDSFNNPALTFNNSKIKLKQEGKIFDIRYAVFYFTFKDINAWNLGIKFSTAAPLWPMTTYPKIVVTAVPNSMYMMLRWRNDVHKDGGLYYSFAQADLKGKLTFTGEDRDRIFAKTPLEWSKNPKNTAIIIGLTGRLDKNVFDLNNILTPAPYRSSLK